MVLFGSIHPAHAAALAGALLSSVFMAAALGSPWATGSVGSYGSFEVTLWQHCLHSSATPAVNSTWIGCAEWSNLPQDTSACVNGQGPSPSSLLEKIKVAQGSTVIALLIVPFHSLIIAGFAMNKINRRIYFIISGVTMLIACTSGLIGWSELYQGCPGSLCGLQLVRDGLGAAPCSCSTGPASWLVLVAAMLNFVFLFPLFLIAPTGGQNGWSSLGVTTSTRESLVSSAYQGGATAINGPGYDGTAYTAPYQQYA